MTRLFGGLFFLLATLSIQAQTGSISGKLTNENKTPLMGVNLLLSNTTYGTVSEKDGSFLLDDIPEGNYTLHISYVGFETFEKQVSVIANQVNDLGTITLSKSQESLKTVYINGEGTNKFAELKSVHVSKMPLKNIENPQVYSTVTAELLEQQVITNFDDALKNVPGIFKLWESTGRGGDGAGYYSLRGFPVQPTLVNGLPAVTNGSPDPANIERIEVVKGPSGTLYGSSLISYGGLINIITKKPYKTFGGSISYTAGSYGLNRVAADINTPLTDEIALRVNTAYHKQNSFQDAGFQKSLFVAPSLSYQANDRLSFLINTEFYSGESTNPTMLFLDRGHELFVHNMDELEYNNERSYTSNDLTINTATYSLQGQMNYKLSDSWTSQTAVSRGSTTSKGIYSYLYGATQFFNLEQGVAFNRYINHQNSTTLTTDIQQNFIGDFEIFGMQNKMVAGLDYFNQKAINQGSSYISYGTVFIGTASMDGDTGNLLLPAVNDSLASATINPTQAQQEVYSAYVSNVINFTPKLSAMLSLRIDQFESEANSQTALSPKFGIVYQPIDDKLAIFANYMDGFSNVAPRIEGDPADASVTPRTVTFEPEHAAQFEVGTKLNLFNNRLVASLSYYDIQVSNIVMERADKPFFYVQDGEKYSRGFETSITANPIDGLNFIAGYSYNESKLVKSDQTAFLGRRPESAGPQHLANLWASYEIQNGAVEGLGFGFGGNHASENMIFNRSNGVFTLDAFTVFNASVFYTIDAFEINLKLNNLADEEYYSGWSTINPQMGRNILAKFTYNF